MRGDPAAAATGHNDEWGIFLALRDVTHGTQAANSCITENWSNWVSFH
jgi:hypothetical protein